VGPSGARLVGVAIDCADAGTVAHFYERILGYEVLEIGPRWAQLRDPDSGMHLNIQGMPDYEPPTWPEEPGKQAKMLHFEVEVRHLESAIAAAEAEGGSQSPWQPPTRDPARLRVMLDPAGHPFCFFLHGE
jgi:catechol 2,3-dioxygenase-like lactoylglutathione lyase family enzyme